MFKQESGGKKTSVYIIFLQPLNQEVVEIIDYRVGA